MFGYDPAIMQQFPATSGGVIIASDMKNTATTATLQDRYETEQRIVLERIGNRALSELPTLSAWRRTFSAFGVNPTKSRSAPEALLRRLTKKGDIPSINSLVDAGNLVSIRYALPVAIFDTRRLTGSLTVRFADGSERYTELGSDEIKHPDPGEVIFVDDDGLVFARRWCWRQSLESAARLDTTEAIIVVESQHEGGEKDIESALSDLVKLLTQTVGGTFDTAILNAQKPAY